MVSAASGAAASDESPAARVLARTELVLDCLPRAIVVWDVDGTVLAWNRSAERLYGWTAAEVLSRHIGEVLITPSDYEEAHQIALSVEEGKPWSGDINILRADGTPVRVLTVLAPLRDDDGTIVGSVGAADDVTDQRIVEERAAELTNHLLMALAGGELGTWRWDMDTGVVHWDEKMERLFGLEPGTFDGTYDAWAAMLHPDDRPNTIGVLDRAIEEGSSYQVEHRVIWPDGSVHWVQGRAMVTYHPDGTVSGTIGCSGDVTSRKLAELEIARRALEAEHLLEEGRLQRRRLEFLASINEAVLAAPNHRELMREVTATAVPMLGDWCSLHFFDGTGSSSGSSPEIVVAHHDPDRVEWLHSLLVKHPYNPDAPLGAAAAIRDGATQFIPSFAGAFRERVIDRAVRATPEEARVILDALQLTSLIAVPLITKRGVIGAMQFVSAESGRLYDRDDVALAETAAGRVAEALDSTWLRDQQRNVATVLQAALLPARLPEIDGLSVAVRYWAAGAASEVGGDFYDVFRIEGDRWAVVIGDVCGTGPEAAAVTSLARHTIRAAATHGASHVEVLEWLNDAILASDSDRFCTVLYSTLERLADGAWRFTSVAGGHPLPFLVRSGGEATPIGRPGTLLGVLPRLRLTVSETDLREGDTLVLNTDGITDVPAPFGIDEVAMAALVTAASATTGPAELVAEHLGDAVQRVLPIPERDDDIALVVIRFTGDHVVDLNAVEAADAAQQRVAEQEFDADPASVSAAREFVVSSAQRPSLSDSLRLAVSELATNAVIHARSPFRVRVVTSPARVRVDVFDRSDLLPQRVDQRADAVSGRGIGIVEHVSSSWGVIPLDVGKSVWFEIVSGGSRDRSA